VETISAFPNQFPYYELLFQNKLSAKTREWAWKHTGWTLFYTSKSRIATPVVKAYRLNVKDFQDTLGSLVGIGWLLPVRPNTQKEIKRLNREFNNGGPNYIFAGDYRYEFKPFYRFAKPIPFSAPRGAVTTFKVPVSVVAEELERLGIKI
jgi:hypothetical protein